ncbi:MAG: biotin--[acetyl-CoA-carboxylase] ligase [Halobacteriaceae archaeon]
MTDVGVGPDDTRVAVLEAIGDGATGPELAEALGVSRTAVWNHVEACREAGFAVESGPDGYRVTGVPEFGALAVVSGLDAPFRVEYHDAIESTNDLARELAASGADDVVVLADEQTGGRGRRDRAWASPSGGVWASTVLRPDVSPARASLVTLAGAVAVTRAAREAGVDARIKWPNDVVVPASGDAAATDPGVADTTGDTDDGTDRGGAKLAGVLTEMSGETGRLEWVVLGTGVNANVPAGALPAGATSLQVASGGPVDRRRFTQRLLEELADLVDDLDAVLDAWCTHETTLGRRVRVQTPGGGVEGTAVDVTPAGALVVETGSGRETVFAGDCEHLRF